MFDEKGFAVTTFPLDVAAAPEREWAERDFAMVRERLAHDVHERFAALSFVDALDAVKPRRGPPGAVGMLARWAIAVDARWSNVVGTFDAKKEALRYRQAIRDKRRPPDRRAK